VFGAIVAKINYFQCFVKFRAFALADTKATATNVLIVFFSELIFLFE